ncbi:MAG: hypothetical protein U5L03_03470, partial [Burkholderiaceae bacterium]|nr:hypothetical protein [Burkholderiaceae bacterium]
MPRPQRPLTRVARAALAFLATLLASFTAAVDAQTTMAVTLAGRSVAVDVYRSDVPLRGAAVLSHGFTRSRTTLGGHAAALAAAGIVALTPDMPTTFDFKHNAQGLAELVGMLRAGGKQYVTEPVGK